MGSTNQTTNLGLPQFADDDRPTWRGDFNGAMNTIDAAHGQLIGQLNNKENKSDLNADVDTHLGGDATNLITNITTRARQPINVANYGFSAPSVTAALADAESRGIGNIAYFPAGTYDVTGVSLANLSCQLRGDGAYAKDNTGANGTVLESTSQNGPVLDFSAWKNGASMLSRVNHSGFVIRGDGKADATKQNSGIRIKALNGVGFSDILIMNTGGPCIEGVANPGNAQYMLTFDRITCLTPISAFANDVPYMIFNEANGCLFNHIGFRSLEFGTTRQDTGPSGAVIIDSPPTFASYGSMFKNFWFENLHPADQGTLFSIKGRAHTIEDTIFFDCFKNTGNTNTSYFRFLNNAGPTFGGNMLRGTIPGRNPDYALSIDYGVDMQQGYNSVVGVKGRSGYNVTISNGVAGTFVEYVGQSFLATGPGVIDNSGGTPGSIYTSTIIDGPSKSLSGGWDLSGRVITVPLQSYNLSGAITKNYPINIFKTVGTTATLPDPTDNVNAPIGQKFVIKNASTGNITIATAGSGATIDGNATVVLAQWAVGRYVTDGTRWLAI